MIRVRHREKLTCMVERIYNVLDVVLFRHTHLDHLKSGPARGRFRARLLKLLRLAMHYAYRWSCWLWVGLAVVLPSSVMSADDVAPGAEIYRERCAECHGTHGEGVKDAYDKPLAGDKSLAELAKLIERTMPEEDPESCIGNEAVDVAQYVYETFYSERAQYRNAPPRIALSRLTVRQYENVVADLIGSFRHWEKPHDAQGLEAHYFATRRFQRKVDGKDVPYLKRIDPQIDFDFETKSPLEKDQQPEDFSIRWEGNLFAPETGDYEFIVHTNNGFRLWVNNRETALIDGWVRSGNKIELRKTIRLLGGRIYPIRLEMFKFKDPSASIHLLWRPPHGVEEIIPQRMLSPGRSSATFVLTTPFPPDDRSAGYERGTSISKEWYEAAIHAALEVAGYVSSHLDRLAGVSSNDPQRAEKIHRFAQAFVERAFRRPLDEEERRQFVTRPLQSAKDSETGIKQVVLLSLTSPRFLYRESARGPMDSYDVAAWLSFTLWDSIPDNQLYQAARKGKLETRTQLTAQARRMLENPRARSKMQAFLHQWLKVDHFPELAKDPGAYPEFTPRLFVDMKTSLDLFLDKIVWSKSSDFRQLFLSRDILMNDRLAEFYNLSVPKDGQFHKVVMDREDRAGILTHPLILSMFAYESSSSPIHRGVFISRSILGRVLTPPPIAVAPTPPELAPDLTTRERITQQTSPAACVKCHRMINDLGFSLEHFDAVGRFRKQEKGKPINDHGEYITSTGETVQFQGIRDLARFLTENEECPKAFARQLFQYSVKQPIQAFGPEYLEELQAHFQKNDYRIQELFVEIAASSAWKAHQIHKQMDVAKSK